MAYPYLDHANHVGLTHARVGDELRLTVTQQTGKMPVGGTIGQIIKKQSATDYDAAWANESAAVLEAVAGGAGFAPVSGTFALDLATARAFHHEMVGNIAGLSFSNVPVSTAFSAAWSWVLRINATGNYSFPESAWPAVTFVDGRSFADADLRPNAVNIFTFWQVGSTVYAALVTNGALAFDPYKVCFLQSSTIVIMAEHERVDATLATSHGTGSFVLQRNGTTFAGTMDFSVGDRLGIIGSSVSGFLSVRVPRFAR